MLVGEQPGNQEDREGEPFIGPAGRLLYEAVSAAGIAAEDLYVTNAVKHFRFEQRGKARIHKQPAVGHIRACHPWLEAELETVAPQVLVCLGATAARAVLGHPVTIGSERGHPIDLPGQATTAFVTVHPSAVLRMRGRDGFEREMDGLIGDLAAAAAHVR
jgi:uracil-DNA glycosylase